MAGLGFLLLAVLCLLLLSAFTDGQLGRGVRGALSGLSSDDAGGVRDRVSATAEGARLGWGDKTPSTRRTVGKTPPQDSLLSGVLGRLSGLFSRGVRAVRDRVSGEPADASDSRPKSTIMVAEPGGVGWYENHYDGDPWPTLEPGQQVYNVDPATQKATPVGWTYDDQQDSTDADGATQPIPAAAGPTEGEQAMNITNEERNQHFPHASGHAGAPGSPGAGAIENLPSYERFLASTKQTILTEQEDAKAAADRHVRLSSSIGDGMGRLAALRVDPQTLREGGEVAERAAIARDKAAALAAALADLDSAMQVAQAGLKRQQQAQEQANSSVGIAERDAYQGA